MSFSKMFQRKRRTHLLPRRLKFETLEDRLALAAFIQADTLQINGSNIVNDYAFVSEYVSTGIPWVKVILSGVQTDFQKSSLPKGINFRGYSGDDVFANTANVVVSAWGGADNDTMFGGSGIDNFYGESGRDTLSGGIGKDYLDGGSEDDVLNGDSNTDTLRGGKGNDDLYGGLGNDKLWGDSGNDELWGDDGVDILDGGGDEDTLYGGGNKDTLYGRDGNDRLFGDGGIDTLWGEKGNDQLFGGDGTDYLYGNEDNDDLYGQNGNDTLDGGGGDDGLFGGLGLFDTVSGSSGADRFLTQDINGDNFDLWDYDSDDLTDVTDEDAEIRFVNDNRAWSEGEIELVDGGLSRLHHLLGNTTLLKDPQNADEALRFYRLDQDNDLPGNYGTNNGTSVLLYDVTFSDPNANFLAYVTIHEIGHFWDESSENDYVSDFRALSGWTTEYGPADVGDVLFVDDVWGEGGTFFVKAEAGDWWYEGGSLFVTDYALTNPFDDFADTFSAVVMGTDFYRNDNDTPDAPVAKRSLIQEWIDSLI